MKKINILWILVIILIIGSLSFFLFQKPESPVQNSQTSQITKTVDDVTIGYSALRISLPIFVAQDQDYFKEEGLNVKLERFDTAQPLMQSLVAGKIQAAGYTALPIIYTAMLRGKTDLYFVDPMLEDQTHRVSFLIVPKTNPGNFTYTDLQGKKVGILPTVAYKVWLQEILKNKGVDAKSVEIVQLDPALQLKALQTKQVDALFTNDPVATTVLQKGVGRLINPDEVELPKIFGEPFIFGSFNIRKDFADKNPEVKKKIVAALDKAVEFINGDQTGSKQIIKNYLSEAQKPYVGSYPDALYLVSTKSDPKIFQQDAYKYQELGIINGKLNVENLIISNNFPPR